MRGWLRQPRLWALMLPAAVLLGLGGASFARRVVATEPLVGLEWAGSSAGPVVLAVSPGSPADLAGLEPGDLVLRIAGHDVGHVLDARQLAWLSPDRGAVEMTVRRGAAELQLVVAPEWSPRTEPYVYLVVVGLTFLLSGLFIAVRWPGIRGGLLYAALAACVFAHLTFSPTSRADRFDWLSSWISDISGSIWPAFLLHLGVAVTKRTLRWRRTVLASAYGVSGLLASVALWLSPATLGGAYRFADPAAAIERWVDRPQYLWMSLAVAMALGLLAKSGLGSPSAMHRSQMRFMVWGLALGLGPFVLFYAVPWALGAAELPDWAQFLSVLPMLLVPAAFTAALARYRLYDFDVLLLRGVQEVTAVIATSAVLAATVFLLRRGLSEILPLSRGACRYIGVLAAAIAYPQLRHLVKKGIERAFYRQRYSYRATLLDWARELATETDLPSLLGLLRTRVRDTLGVADVEVLIRTAEERFEASGGALRFEPELVARLSHETSVTLEEGLADLPWARHLFSMRVKGRLRAVLAVAERSPSEEPLTSEDRALLRTLAAQAATAIETARLVREVRSRAEEIERLHELQARILESSAVGLFLVDGGGRILAWNRALEQIYGLSRAEAIGRRISEVLPLELARHVEREGRTPEARLFRFQLADRRGRRLIANVAISRVGGAGSADEGGLVVTLDDVTERVELEEQMLQQERLASLGLLAAGVAHEINTPLTGISSFTQLLLEEETSAGRREMLGKIEAQTQRAAGITRSLLNLARPVDTTVELVDLNDAVREIVQVFEPQARRRGVRLVLMLDEELPQVVGRRGQLQQVLLNLLLNARDAVGQQGEIAVTTHVADGAAWLEVTDDGAGIAEEDLPRIFDPFFTTKGRGGTGLGLSISFNIVREHGGQIRAESRRGQPTRFRVELPAAEPHAVVAGG